MKRKSFMKNRYVILFFVGLLSFLQSCGVVNTGSRHSRSIYSKKKYSARVYRNEGKSPSGQARTVVEEASSYIGTPYRYGGETRNGMDCSGLLLNSYQKIDMNLPRVSYQQAEYGEEISIEEARPGDALFFNTAGGDRINHAGIIERIEGGEVFFIHSSSSRGVMISSLNSEYWGKRFVKAVRFID